MTTREHKTIDFVARETEPQTVVLIMVEDRPWGPAGMLLPDLQAKFETYLNYVTSGQLKADYPIVITDPVRIELRCAQEPGQRERELIDIVVRNYLSPEGIAFTWRLIDGA